MHNVNATVLQILIVDDSEKDVVLLLAELECTGCAIRHQRVDTKEAFLDALKAHAWDAVICDYVMPQFSGPDALKLLRQQGLDTPFIMVSGIYGEEMAVEVMKAGANDYLLKGNLSRLAPTLKRELEAFAGRRRYQRAEAARQYLAAIVESSEDAIYGKNLDSIVVSWNLAAERLFGYSAEEIVGCSIVMLSPLNRRDELLDILASVRRGDTVRIRETERRHKNGDIIPVSVTISPVKNSDGEIIGSSGIVRDIRQHTQAEFEHRQRPAH